MSPTESANIDICQMAAASAASDSTEPTSPTPVRQNGFLRTPNYPGVYPNNMNCTYTLEAPYDGQQIRVFTVDAALETNGTGCADWVQYFDGFKGGTMCSSRSRTTLETTQHRSFHIHFVSNAEHRRKGLWLYYECTFKRSLYVPLFSGNYRNHKRIVCERTLITTIVAGAPAP